MTTLPSSSALRGAGFALGYAIECSEPGQTAAVAIVGKLEDAYRAIVERLLEVAKDEAARDDDLLLVHQLKAKAIELDCQSPHLAEVVVGPYAYKIREALP